MRRRIMDRKLNRPTFRLKNYVVKLWSVRLN